MQNDPFHTNMAQVKEKFLLASEKGANALQLTQENETRVSYILKERSEFTGATLEDYCNYLREGYTVSEFENFDTSAIPVRKRKRPRYNDCEGDFRYDSFVSGDENCFTEWTKREAVPGIHVQFFLGFRAVTPASVITEYCKWVLQALTTLEANGVDCSVSLFNRGVRRYRNFEGISEFHIDVKREGERNDFSEWSALLAPGSYRILGFFCLVLMAEFNNRACASNFGASNAKEWGVSWNSEMRVIEIRADSSGKNFPAERMTQELADAIAAARTN